jgi:CheY-like chemotaxis protein
MQTPETQKSILLIDDDKFLIEMYSLKFKNSGFDVYFALGPEEALKQLRGGLSPSIILMDLVMPAMDGLELLSVIRKEELAKQSVIIMLTNQGVPDDISRAKKLNVNGYIIKASSIPSEVLTEVIRIYESSKK